MKALLPALLLLLCGPVLGRTSDEAIQDAKQKISEKMKDPESAKFRNVVYDPATDKVCGQVNAKNSYGGYTGYDDFLVSGSLAWTRKATDALVPGVFQIAWEKCPVAPKEAEAAKAAQQEDTN